MFYRTIVSLPVIIYQPDIIIGIQTKCTFRESLQIMSKTIACFIYFTAHIDPFGSNISQRITFVHIKIGSTGNGRSKVGIFIHLIQININRLQISLGETSFLTTRIISDYLLISLDSLRILISLIIEQTYFVSRSTGHIAFREFLQQNIETINSIRMILHLNKSTALLIQSIIQILRLGIIRYQTV